MEEKFLIGMWHYIVSTEGLPVKVTGELCSLEDFRRQLGIIKERFNVINSDRLVRALREEEELPDRSLVLTFDDGTKDHYKVALSVLLEMGLTATFAIITSTLTGKIPSQFKLQLIFGEADRKVVRYEIFPTVLRKHGLEKYLEGIEVGYYRESQEISEIKWTCNAVMKAEEKDLVIGEIFEQILPGRESEFAKRMFMAKPDVMILHKTGMTIASHGVNHYDMRTISPEKQRKELLESKKHLEEILDSKVSTFFFTGPPVSSSKEIAKEVGYLAAFEYNPSEQVNTQAPYDIFALKRIHERNLDKEFLT